MKKILLLICLAISFQLAYSQGTTITKTLVHGSLTRSYIEHVPTIYNPSTPVPLVICLHGLGDNMSNFSGIGMHQVSDTANFIVLTPQAISSPLGTAWNAGASYSGYQINGTIDDIGFISKLIDTTMALYNIDPRRIYATGFSLGGFMCNRLACQLNNRIAAIASVAGTIGSALNCVPGRAFPVCHFHGTGDSTIAYNGNLYGMDAMALVKFWANNNHCDTIPIVTDIPDIVQDGFTIKHFVYANGDDNTVVEHFRVDSAGHQWIYPPVNDMSYTLEIWKFLSRFTLPSWIGVESRFDKEKITVFPNPANDYLNINGLSEKQAHITIYNTLGSVVYENPSQSNTPINIKKLNKGLYIMKVVSNSNSSDIQSFKIIKQ